MTKTAWIIFAAISILLLGSLVYISGQNKLDVKSVQADTVLSGSEASGGIGDHVYGNKESDVLLVEYGDFQCPGCASVHPTVQQIKEEYKDDIAFVFRNFPLTSIHPHALIAAASAEAAGKQGKYWEMHDKLYAAQDEWSNVAANDRAAIFEGYAAELGLDVEQFKEDVTDPTVTKKINFDLALGKEQGVESTPTFILNGRILSQDEWSSVESLKKAIDAEIKKQQ